MPTIKFTTNSISKNEKTHNENSKNNFFNSSLDILNKKSSKCKNNFLLGKQKNNSNDQNQKSLLSRNFFPLDNSSLLKRSSSNESLKKEILIKKIKVEKEERKLNKTKVIQIVKSESKNSDLEKIGREKERLHSCDQCEFKTSLKKDWEDHMGSHQFKSLFKCCFCSFSGVSESFVQHHITRFHKSKNILSSQKIKLGVKEDWKNKQTNKQKSKSKAGEANDDDEEYNPNLGKNNSQKEKKEVKVDEMEDFLNKKMPLYCLYCNYKTFSLKVLKKHLIREHSEMIDGIKFLNILSKKCLKYSLKVNLEEKDDEEKIQNKKEEKKKQKQNDDEVVREGDGVFLHMAVESEDLQDELNKKSQIKFKEEKTTSCPVCNRKFRFKWNAVKHISTMHPEVSNEKNSGKNRVRRNSKFDLKKGNEERLRKIEKVNREKLTKEEIRIVEEMFASQVEKGNNQIHNETNDRKEEEEKNENDIEDGTVKKILEKIGMTDELRLKRFKCSSCPFRSNFRSDIGRHLKVKHFNNPEAKYSILSISLASKTLESYNAKKINIDMRYRKNKLQVLSRVIEKPSVRSENKVSNSSENNFITDSKPPAKKKFEGEIKFCPICPFTTDKAELLRLHLNCHESQNRNTLKCPHCPFYVSTTRLLRNHIALHQYQNAIYQQIINSHDSNNGNHNNMSEVFVASMEGHNLFKLYPSSQPIHFRDFSHHQYKYAHYRYCQYKYICDQCPFHGNERGDYWCHRKGHLSRRLNKLTDHKCSECGYVGEDKRDAQNHSVIHESRYTPIWKGSKMFLNEWCRCDLADSTHFSSLACFKSLKCPYCYYQTGSVMFLRQHIVTHVAFSDVFDWMLFSKQLDKADMLLSNICTRLLNMNYSLVQEEKHNHNVKKKDTTRRGIDASKKEVLKSEQDTTSDVTDDLYSDEMPILQKITDPFPVDDNSSDNSNNNKNYKSELSNNKKTQAKKTFVLSKIVYNFPHRENSNKQTTTLTLNSNSSLNNNEMNNLNYSNSPENNFSMTSYVYNCNNNHNDTTNNVVNKTDIRLNSPDEAINNLKKKDNNLREIINNIEDNNDPVCNIKNDVNINTDLATWRGREREDGKSEYSCWNVISEEEEEESGVMRYTEEITDYEEEKINIKEETHSDVCGTTMREEDHMDLKSNSSAICVFAKDLFMLGLGLVK